MARPTKTLTEEQVKEVQTLAQILSIVQIADYFGVARNTFYKMMERDVRIDEQYKRGKARAIGSVAQGLLQKARDGDTASQIFYLKTQAGWRETHGVDHTTKGEAMKSQEIDFSKLSKGAVQELVDLMDSEVEP